MRYFVILLILLGFVGTAFAYHGEQQRLEVSQMTGIFDSENNLVMFPLVDEQYRLQIVIGEQTEYENYTITVGYGFNFLERIPNKMSAEIGQDFMGFNKTISSSISRDSKTIEANQYEFPIRMNFTVNFEKPGVYHYSYFDHKFGPSTGGSSSAGGLHVVSSYSKAVDENGDCKNPELNTLAKYDFSTLVCVKPSTHHELITRGWAPLPG